MLLVLLYLVYVCFVWLFIVFYNNCVNVILWLVGVQLKDEFDIVVFIVELFEMIVELLFEGLLDYEEYMWLI